MARVLAAAQAGEAKLREWPVPSKRHAVLILMGWALRLGATFTLYSGL